MATMEDRLLGEKLHYYCSSDESDIEEEDEGNKEENEFDVDKSRQAKLNEISEKEAYMNVGLKIFICLRSIQVLNLFYRFV